MLPKRLIALTVVTTLALASVVSSTRVVAQTHWQRQSIGGQSVTAIAAADSLDYVALGDTIVGTRDGGIHWDSLFTSPSYNTSTGKLSFNISLSYTGLVHSKHNVIIVAADSSSHVTYWHDNIHSYPPDSDQYILSGIIMRSTDRGASWNTMSLGPWNAATSHDVADAIASLDSDHIIVALGASDHFVLSTNGGKDWQSIPAPQSLKGFINAAYPATNTIVVVQYDTAYAWTHRYRFLRTTNLGATWSSSAQTSHDISGLCFITASIGFASAWDYNGSAYTNYIDRTTDGGLTWTNVYTSLPGQTGELRCIAFADKLHGLVAGRNGLLLRTTNGGQMWTTEPTGYPNVFLDAVAFPDTNHAIVCSAGLPPDDGLIYVINPLPDTPDITYPAAIQPVGVPPEFDATWTMQSDAAKYDVFLLGFDVTKGCWCDTLVHDTVTTKSHHFKLPSNELQYHLYVTALDGDKKGNPAFRTFTVFQPASVAAALRVSPQLDIYPNPFSSSTTISLTPQATGYPDISIVNLLGIEVAHLFAGELEAGEHTFTWSATPGLPDGMYECLVRMNGRVEKLPVMLLR